MASGSAVTTTQNLRRGRSVRTVSHASGTAMATDAAVTLVASRPVRHRSPATRSLSAMSVMRPQPSSAARTTR